MANDTWHVVVDGEQLPGQYEREQVEELLTKYTGKQVRVWKAGMAAWADPATLPEFPAPAPAPAPAAARSAPGPAAQGPSRPVEAAPRASSPSPARGLRPAAAPISSEELQEQAGVFKALLDFNFNTVLTPKLIKAVYILVMAMLALGVVGFFLSSLVGFRAGFGAGILGLVLSIVIMPIVAILYLALVRMSLEMIMAVYKIKEYTGILAEKARRDSGTDEP
jgi:hypothetical protein